ncbi:MAG: hypothetical protein JWO03_89 [Bacteroidetes bacterium]|nr:hypothetical protein [Bacteroidota bacterium]
MRKLLCFIIVIFTVLYTSAQSAEPIPSLMESNLKIYVVVGVLTIIFSGIIIFLLSMDRRLKKLEEGH